MEVKSVIRVNGREDPRLVGIETALKSIGPKLAKKTMRRALRAVGKFWISDMKPRVPVDSGELAKSLAGTVRIRRKGRGAIGRVKVGPRLDKDDTRKGGSSQSPGVYGMFVEFGTKKMPAEPFMRPTFDSTADKVISIFADAMKEGLAEAAKEVSSGDTTAFAPFEVEEDIADEGGSGSPAEAIRKASDAVMSGLKRRLG